MGYISNYLPLVPKEKPFYKTHAPVFIIGVPEKFLGF